MRAMTATHIIGALVGFFTVLLALFVLTIVLGPSWTPTTSGEGAPLADPEYPAPMPQPVRPGPVQPDHAPRHAPGHAPAFTPDSGAPLPPVYRAYTPRHLPVQPPNDRASRPQVSG